MNTKNTNTDSILTHNQKTGLAITGFSLLIGAMAFLVGTGVLILSMFLFGLGVYMFFKKDEEIGKEPLIQTKENYFYQKPLFETEQEKDLETLMKEAEEEPHFYVKPLFETKRERLERVLSMIDDHDPTDLITDPAFRRLRGNIFYHDYDDDYDNTFFEDD